MPGPALDEPDIPTDSLHVPLAGATATAPADLRAALASAWAAQAMPTNQEVSPSRGTPPVSAPGLPSPPAGTTAPAADLQAQLAALWVSQASLSSPATEDDLAVSWDTVDAAEMAAERVAIQVTGGCPDPPTPPPGSRFFYQDYRGRPCARAGAATWTWEGAPRWYHVLDFPLPTF
jgi:hypothetical protein